MQKNTHKGGLIVLIIIIALILLFGVYGLLASSGKKSGMKRHFPEQKKEDSNGSTIVKLFNHIDGSKKNSSGNYIAALHIKGTIEDENKNYNQQWLLDTIDDLTDDSKNVAIMLYIDSPGGGVYEADEAYLALLDYKKETGRPVYAYMGPLAASGGYYIACAADSICANRNTLTGSIGVLAGESLDMTGLLNKLGVKVTTIHAGKNKNMLNFNEPLTDEQKAIMQAVADEAYDQFTGIVAKSRKLKIAAVRSLADGRIYTAKQALNNGLIDRVCSWDDAIATLEHDYFKDADIDVEDCEYESKESFYDMMLGSLAKISGQKASLPLNALEEKAVAEALPSLPFPAYYYAGSVR